MFIKIGKIKNIIGCILIFYVTNKFLFDNYLGGSIKMIYYALILIGAILGIYEMMINKRYDIILTYVVYDLIVLFNAFVISNEAQRTIGIIQYISFPMVLFAVYYYLHDFKYWNKLATYYCLWGIVLATLSIYEYIFNKAILSNLSTITTYYNGIKAYRATVFQGSPMVLGIVLGSNIVIAFTFLCLTHEKKYMLLVIFLSIGSFATGSRGPFVATVMGMLMVYLILIKERTRTRSFIIGTAILWCCVICIMGYLLIFGHNISTGIQMIDNIIKRFVSATDFTNEWGNVERIKRWTYYIERFINKPILGYGIASTSADVLTNSKATAHGVTTESGLLAHMVETGIVGTLAYYVCLLVCIWHAVHKGKNIKVRGIVVGIIVMFMIEDMILQISMDLISTFVLWSCIAIGIIESEDCDAKIVVLKFHKT